MNAENDKKLVDAHPILFRDRYADMRVTAMCWGFDCGDGWFDIVWKLSQRLEAMNRNLPIGVAPIVASQVKEKYGTLRFYVMSLPSMVAEEAEKAIEMAEKDSAVTCETCGAKGQLRNETGWLTTECDDCYARE